MGKVNTYKVDLNLISPAFIVDRFGFKPVSEYNKITQVVFHITSHNDEFNIHMYVDSKKDDSESDGTTVRIDINNRDQMRGKNADMLSKVLAKADDFNSKEYIAFISENLDHIQ